MIKLLRYWNQNKRKILITIGVIALIIVIIQIANIVAKKQNEADKNHNKQNVQKMLQNQIRQLFQIKK